MNNVSTLIKTNKKKPLGTNCNHGFKKYVEQGEEKGKEQRTEGNKSWLWEKKMTEYAHYTIEMVFWTPEEISSESRIAETQNRFES